VKTRPRTQSAPAKKPINEITKMITTIEEFMTSSTEGQVTFFSSASVSISNSAVFGVCCQRCITYTITAKSVVEIKKARESGATGAFWEKYPDVVTVYNIKAPPTSSGQAATVYSRELCGGPHVQNTSDLAKFGKFKIKKESSSSAGVRRIKAVFVIE